MLHNLGCLCCSVELCVLCFSGKVQKQTSRSKKSVYDRGRRERKERRTALEKEVNIHSHILSNDPKDCSQCSQVMIQIERSMNCCFMTSWPLLISSLSTGFIRRIRISPRFCTCLKKLHTNLWGFVVDDKVTRLQKSLAQELNLRNALNRGLHRALGSLPRIPNNLPVEVMNRLSFMILESQLSKKKIMGRQTRWNST